MALNETPNRLESVFIQRDATNAYYEQINISGSDLMIYHKEDGTLTADKVSVWASKYGIGGGGSTVKVTSADTVANYLASKLVTGSGITLTVLNPGSAETLQITSTGGGVSPGGSYDISSSYASASMWALFATQSSIATSSLFASQSTFTTSSLYALQSTFTTNSLFSSQSTFSTSSIFASQSTFSTSSLYASQSTFATSSIFASQSAFATQSLFATNSLFSSRSFWAESASYASESFSSSYAGTSSHALTASTLLGSIESASFAYTASYALNAAGGESASWASSSISSSYADTASFLLGSIESASYALTASYALNGGSGPGGGGAKSIMLCAAFTPNWTGADDAEIPIPYDSDGVTPVSWSINRFNIRVKYSGSSTSSVSLEKSTGDGEFVPTTLATLYLNSQSYETYTSSLEGIASGEKIRFNVNTLGTAQYWTLTTEINTL